MYQCMYQFIRMYVCMYHIYAHSYTHIYILLSAKARDCVYLPAPLVGATRLRGICLASEPASVLSL